MNLEEEIFLVDGKNFDEVALKVFQYQFEQVEIYNAFCTQLNKTPQIVKSVTDIPFLPIDFFKSHAVISKEKQGTKIFESSGTTGQVPSKHSVADLSLYEKSFQKCFEQFYGDISEYIFLALLPSYLERENSSLVYMAKNMIVRSNQNASDFFLNDFEKLYDWLDVLKQGKRKVILLGVTFALLDFAAQYKIDFTDLIVMETGGMKGRREELTREEVHMQLRTAFDVKQIHSEYGMTELLSQAYSKGNGIFNSPNWMKILTRDIYDPLKQTETGSTGGINVIDLANLYSCSFIATGDLGKTKADGSFEILGRLDSAEVRGCNLMAM